MYGYTGYYQGKRVSVMGTGMGCPSMGIYSYELIHFYGCKNLIRIGTAGALRPEVKVRELIFAMGSLYDIQLCKNSSACRGIIPACAAMSCWKRRLSLRKEKFKISCR